MTNTEYETLKVGELVRHKSGKLYKVTYVSPKADDTFCIRAKGATEQTVLTGEAAREAYANHRQYAHMICTVHFAHEHEISFRQWQVNEKHPAGRYYEATKSFTADKIEMMVR